MIFFSFASTNISLNMYLEQVRPSPIFVILNFRKCPSSKSSPDLKFFHAQFLPEPVGTSPCWLIQLPDPFCRNPFFEKAKFRNLEISRPYRRPFRKFRIPGRPILILNSRLKAYQKMVTAMALQEVNQIRQGSFNSTSIFSFNIEIKNGKRSGYKK